MLIHTWSPAAGMLLALAFAVAQGTFTAQAKAIATESRIPDDQRVVMTIGILTIPLMPGPKPTANAIVASG